MLEGSLIGGFSYFVPVLSKGRLGPGSAENCSGFSHPETAKRQTHPDTKKVKHWGRTQGDLQGCLPSFQMLNPVLHPTDKR